MQNEVIHALDISTSCLQGLLTDLHPAFGHSWALFGSLCVGVDGPPCSAQLSAPNDQ